MRTIRNGNAFPKAVKLAALKATKLKANKNRSLQDVAGDFNISKSTLANWKRTAGLSQAVPTGLAAHQAAAAAIKVYNTVVYVDNSGQQVLTASNATHFELRGKKYSL